MSIRFKIALMFAGLVTLILLIAGVFVYLFSIQELQKTFSERLKNRAWATSKIYATINDKNYFLWNKMDNEIVASLYDKSISILNENNEYDYVYFDSPRDSLLLNNELITRVKMKGELFFTSKNRIAFALHKVDSKGSFIFAIAATDINGSKYLEQLRRLMLIAGFFGVAISFITGLIFAKTLTRPIKKIIEEVNLISSNNLSQRLKVSLEKDELNGLVNTLNTLLNRLQDSFAIQRRFISNASHELSTPLTSISSQLEVALQKERTEEEYREVVTSVYDDIKDLHLLTHSLLDLAKAGTQGSIDLVDVRIDEVILKVASDVQKLQSNYRVVIDFENFSDNENDVTVFGNQNLLYIAFKNIVENGCKYSIDHTAKVLTTFKGTEVIVSVSSVGDIIAESDIQNIFQPFFRTDSARPIHGFGLGLTLTKRILSLHQSKIEVSSKPDLGTKFIVKLPNKYSPL